MSEALLSQKIVAGLLVSTDYLKRVKDIWRDDLVESSAILWIARQCFAFYEKHQRAPDRDIDLVYMNAIRDQALPKAEAELIEGALSAASAHYGQGKDFNASYIYDRTVDYFRTLNLQAHNGTVTGLIERGRYAEAEQVIRDYEEAVPGKRLIELKGGQDLLATELEPPEMLVSGMLPKGVIVLAGPPKLGKSLLALHLCLCVCGRFIEDKKRIIPRQVRFLGHTVKHGHALYFDLEGNEFRLQSRVRRFIDGRNIDVAGFRYSFEAPSLSNGFSSVLQGVLEEDPKLRFVVIDIWEKIRGQRTGNRDIYNDAVTEIGVLQRLVNKYDVSIVIVTHTNKNASAKGIDKILGTIGLAGSVDTPAVLTKILHQDEEGHRRGRLEVVSRDCEPSDLLLELDPDSLTWRSLGEYQEEEGRGQRKSAEIEIWLANVLKDGPLSASDIERLAEEVGYSMSAVKRASIKLHIRKDRTGYQGGSEWSMPTQRTDLNGLNGLNGLNDGTASPENRRVAQVSQLHLHRSKH
jgi:hypothetical protein